MTDEEEDTCKEVLSQLFTTSIALNYNSLKYEGLRKTLVLLEYCMFVFRNHTPNVAANKQNIDKLPFDVRFRL